MAAVVASTEADDETWLYGDPEQKSEEATKKSQPVEGATSDPVKEKPIDKEAGELSGEEEAKAAEAVNGDEEEETDSDDDDDVQVTIGDIKTGSQLYDGTRNLFKGPGKYQKPGEAGVFSKTKGLDVDAPGEINGVSVFEFDLDNLQVQEKPWRKPGADITDYFNYGFNEESWQLYSEKQKRLRNEALMGGPKVYMHHSSSLQSKMDKDGSQNSVNASVPTSGTNPIGWKAAPPPNRKMSGTIDVIGSTAKDSRRPASSNMGEPIQVADSSDYRKSYGGSSSSVAAASHIPTIDYSLPPPGVPPMGMSSLPPPPGMSVPPPGYPGSTDPYDTYYPPAPGSVPPSDSHRTYAYDSSSAAYGYGTQASTGHSHWESRSGYADRWEYGRERSPTHSENEYTSKRRRRRSRSRDYYRERGRDRESSSTRDRTVREDRHRVKDERHRSRSKDRHYSSRRKHREDEDSDPHRAKHKRSKRSRKDKEDDGVDSAALSGADENVKVETT